MEPDNRFIFADKNYNADNQKQLVSGNEVKQYLPRGNPTSFEWGDKIEFELESGPFLISNKNHIQISGRIQRKAVADTEWKKLTTDDADKFVPVENLGSAMIENCKFRQGIDDMETNGFISKGGRVLHENFVLAHSSESSKAKYIFAATDPGQHCYLQSSEFAKGSEKLTAFNKKIFEEGFVFNVMPMCWPFEWKSRSVQTDKMFPNLGQPAVVQLNLNANPENLYILPDGGAVKYQIVIESIRLHIATPRLTAEGQTILSNPNMPDLIFDNNYYVQYQFSHVKQASKEISINRIHLPEYMLIQLYKRDYFTGNANVARTKFSDKPLQMNLGNIEMTFGNKELSHNMANFNIDKAESNILRQEILKTSNIFDVKEMNQKYFYDMENYQHHHYLFSLCSNETTQEKLRPLDATVVQKEKQSLKINLTSKDRTEIPEGKIIITLIYKHLGNVYSPQQGKFLNSNAKAEVVTS